MRTIAEAMAENVGEPETTVSSDTPEQVNIAQPQEEDIVARVSKHKPTTTTEPESNQDTTVTEKFNVNDIDKIADPEAKSYAEKAYKSFEKGYQQKFQELATERKTLEEKMSEMNKWTPEKVQSLLSNQEFINASQAILQSSNPTEGQMTDEEWSALSDRERAEIKSMKQELLQMKQQNAMTKFQAELDKQNAELANKYSDYDSAKVNQLRNDMIGGKIQATNEHLWKVLNYEDAVRKAYLMGKEDSKGELGIKVNSSNPVVGSATQASTGDSIPREGESPKQFLMRRLSERMKERTNKK